MFPPPGQISLFPFCADRSTAIRKLMVPSMARYCAEALERLSIEASYIFSKHRSSRERFRARLSPIRVSQLTPRRRECRFSVLDIYSFIKLRRQRKRKAFISLCRIIEKNRRWTLVVAAGEGERTSNRRAKWVPSSEFPSYFQVTGWLAYRFF